MTGICKLIWIVIKIKAKICYTDNVLVGKAPEAGVFELRDGEL